MDDLPFMSEGSQVLAVDQEAEIAQSLSLLLDSLGQLIPPSQRDPVLLVEVLSIFFRLAGGDAVLCELEFGSK